MRYLDRSKVAVPPPLRDGDDGQPTPRLAWYHDLRRADGRIKDRWNDRDLGDDRESSTRQALLSLGQNLCAYCERRLESGWHVDHFLPKEQHPYLAYHFDNLLPTCPGCNSRKRAFDSCARIKQQIVDPIVVREHPDALPFDKAALLPNITDRLIDPSFDEPTAHLRFVPETLCWEGLTPQGERTAHRILVGDKAQAEHWQRLSDKIKANIEDGSSERLLSIDAELLGCPTVFWSLVTYWKDLLAPLLQPTTMPTAQP